MKIGILCASDDELAPFLPRIEHHTIAEKAKLHFHCGQIEGVEVVALYSGVCKVNAAIAAQLLIDVFRVDAIINAGTAGGIDPDLQILDTVISTEAVYHDVAKDILTEFHPWLEKPFFPADKTLIALSKSAATKLKTPRRVYWGRIATGEAFIDDAGRREINAVFSPLCVDMETAAIAHVCYCSDIPFLAVRSITDTAKHSGTANFEENCRAASDAACEITTALIREIRES